MLLHSFVSVQLTQQFSVLSQMEKISNNPMKWENKIDQVVKMAVLQKLGVRDTDYKGLGLKLWPRHVSWPGKGTGTLAETTKRKKATNQRNP